MKTGNKHKTDYLDLSQLIGQGLLNLGGSFDPQGLAGNLQRSMVPMTQQIALQNQLRKQQAQQEPDRQLQRDALNTYIKSINTGGATSSMITPQQLSSFLGPLSNTASVKTIQRLIR